MDQASKYEMSRFGVEHRPDREKPEREQRLRGPLRLNVSQHKKPFSRRSYKPGHYTPAEQIKGGPVCYHCNKPGHFKRDCSKLKIEQGNDQPRQ
ncbi:unnamed protein product [Phytophthora fragariaefolia]|uniref:Unnamed protein product n=1 Tax=Phytophthora fragariaefolia TaxID=1490495 RepID=A0A9W6XVB4_9STRA|nr:unnamed protein product [Phytophthora fragariaefolia]